MASRAGSEQSLKRDIGWFGSFAMGYADVGADIYIALGLVALYAAGAAPLAFAIASISYVATGLAYSELASTYPYAGGAQVYAMKAFNDLSGFIAGWAVMLDYIVNLALFSLAAAGYLSYFFPYLRHGSLSFQLLGLSISVPMLGVAAFLLVVLLLCLNLIGIRESSLFNEALVVIDLAVEMLIFSLGMIFAFNLSLFLSQILILGSPDVLPTIAYIPAALDIRLQNFIYGVTIAMTSFIGIESIAQAAEETRRPYKWIPRAGKMSVLAVAFFTVGLSILSMGSLGWEELANARVSPLALLASRIPIIGYHIAYAVAFAAFLISYASANTGVIGVSRVVYSMGRYNLLPRWFHRVHPVFRTPTRTILAFGLVGAALALIGELTIIADLYNFGALLSYVLVNLSLMALRNVEPEAYRPWKVPGTLYIKGSKKKMAIPVLGLVGVISCGTLWLLVILFHEGARFLGFSWILVGLAIFTIYRKRNGQRLLSKEGGKAIAPGGYVMNAAVLVRLPEDPETIASLLEAHVDKRFRLTLVSLVDPKVLNINAEDVRGQHELHAIADDTSAGLKAVSERLRHRGYEADARVFIGPSERLVEALAESPENDLIVLIRRKMFKSHLEKHGEEGILSALSRYPGKLMVIRREG